MVDQEMLQAMRQMLQEELKPIKEEQAAIREELAAIREEQAAIREELAAIKEKLEVHDVLLKEISDAVVQNSVKISELKEKLDDMSAVVRMNCYDIAWLKNKVS